MIKDVRELCSFEGRLAGTDAERRAANALAAKLRRTAHRVDVEPTYVHPQWALIHALHTALGFAGSLLSIPLPAAGFALRQPFFYGLDPAADLYADQILDWMERHTPGDVIATR